MTEKTALLVVDAQVAILEEGGGPHESAQMLANIRQLIDGARAAGTAVIYVRHTEPKYEPMNLGADGWQVHPAIAPEPNDATIDKFACDSFHDTDLQAILSEAGIGHLVVAGMQTEMCVDTVCRSALHRDYNVTLAADAHSTWDSNGLQAAQIIAHHNSTLANIPHPTKGITVKPTAEISFV